MSTMSIIIPTLNCGQTLAATLDSISPLLDAGAELVVADSYSQDNTLELAKSCKANIIQIPPGNMYRAINAGIKLCCGDWITYINGDDILYSDSVKMGMEKYGESADMFYGSIDYIDIYGRFLHSWNSPSSSLLLWIIKNGINPIPQQGTFFKRTLYNELGGFNEKYKYCGDYDFFHRAIEAGYSLKRLKYPRIAAFRLHGSQITQKKSKEMKSEVQESLKISSKKVNKALVIVGKMLFRMNNADSYIVRCVRNKCIKGNWKASRTCDI